MADPLTLPLDVPFDEAIAWARARIAVLPNFYYGTLPAQARSRANTISGLASLDQIQAAIDSLAQATEAGETFAAWQKRQSAELLALGEARLDNIFRTAIQTHYNVGQYQQQQANAKRRPFLMYDAINDSRVRETHRALDGFIAPIDDPIWDTIYPPNGYRCRCGVISLSERQARQRGWDGVPKYRLDGAADDGWDYNPAKGQDEALSNVVARKLRQCEAFTFAKDRIGKPVWCEEGKAQDYARMIDAWAKRGGAMPEPRRANIALLPAGQKVRYCLERFMGQFESGPHETAFVTAKTGSHQLAVSGLMFEDHLTGASKITKAGRAPYLLYVASTVLDPDEIWAKTGVHGDNTLYFLSRYVIKNDTVNIFAVFKEKGALWESWTGYQDRRPAYLESKRIGQILYARPET